MTILRELKEIYKLFPKKFKNKSLIFIFLLIFSAIIETLGIGIIFPLIEVLIKGEFSRNLLGINLTDISLNLDDKAIIRNLILTIIFLYLFKAIFLVLFNYRQLKFSHNIFKYLSLKLFNRYLLSSISFYHKKNSAFLLRNTIFESRNYGNCVSLILKLIAETLIIIFIFSLVIYIEPEITSIITFVLGFLIILFYLLTSKKIYKFGEHKLFSAQKAIKVLNESFNGIRDIKLKASEYFFYNTYKSHLGKNIKAGNYQQAIVDSPRILFEFIFILLLLSGLLYYLKFEDNVIDLLPLVSMYLVAGFRLIPSVMRILNILQTIKGLQPSIQMLNKEFEGTDNLIQRSKDINLKKFSFNEKIELNDVSFSYDNKSKILTNFSKIIYKNQILGISGSSGSGKSTLIDLLTGLLTPTSGKILIDNKININDNLQSWQSKIGYVSQNIFLLDTTIRENIAFGEDNNDIDDQKIEKSLKDTQLFNYVSKLDQGLNTIVGERGVKLSGGQVQRIGIARELYRNPELIIFDESTSALDIDTEDQILHCINGLKKNKTIIIVSHRQNTLKICDEVIKLNG